MDIDLKPEQLDYIFLKLFEFSNNIELFPYARIFEVF